MTYQSAKQACIDLNMQLPTPSYPGEALRLHQLVQEAGACKSLPALSFPLAAFLLSPFLELLFSRLLPHFSC